MSAVGLRRAVPADAAAIAAGLADLARYLKAETAMDAALVERHGFGRDALFDVLLAEADGGVLGLALYFRHFSTLRGCAGVYVQDLWVADAARGRGAGLRLLQGVAHEARQGWGARYLALSVDRANEGAERFYRREGFTGQGYELPMFADGAAFEGLLQG